MNTNDLAYFMHEKKVSNKIYFSRFPESSFEGKKILDLGCGHGAVSIDLAEKGAGEVIGVDIDEKKIEFAKANLEQNYSKLRDRVSFLSISLRDLNMSEFDIVVSKASFEHIIDLKSMLNDIKEKLKIGGKLFTGFGPLYNSPLGDHHAFRCKLPWMHAILPQKFLINRLNKIQKRSISNVHDLGLNGLSLKEYRSIMKYSKGLEVEYFETNVSRKSWNKIFIFFSKIGFLEEYFTHNIYCILVRSE